MNLKITSAAVISLAAASSLAVGGITIDVVASSAPNSFGSPSWNGYLANSLNSLEFGFGNIGDRNTDPTAYEVAGATVDASDLMVSSFNSWRGDSAPTGAFAGEFGNRIHFGLHATGDGITKFRLNDLGYEISSNDVGNTMAFSGTFAGANFSSTRFGVDWGADNAKGGGDDTYFNSGNGMTLVDEIVYVGVGNAFWPGDAAEMAAMLATYSSGFSMTGEYTIDGFSGTGIVTTVPAPGAFALLGLGGLAATRRRRA